MPETKGSGKCRSDLSLNRATTIFSPRFWSPVQKNVIFCLRLSRPKFILERCFEYFENNQKTVLVGETTIICATKKKIVPANHFDCLLLRILQFDVTSFRLTRKCRFVLASCGGHYGVAAACYTTTIHCKENQVKNQIRVRLVRPGLGWRCGAGLRVSGPTVGKPQ